MYSVRFTIISDEITISYTEQEERLYIQCIAKKVLFLGNTIVPTFENDHYNIELFVASEDANVISKELNCPLNVMR